MAMWARLKAACGVFVLLSSGVAALGGASPPSKETATKLAAETGRVDFQNGVVRAGFLEDLLTGRLTEGRFGRHGLVILNARVADAVDLSEAEVPCAVAFWGCTFGTLDLTSVRFARDACFGNCTIGSIRLVGAEVHGSLTLVGTTFLRDVNLHGMHVYGDLNADRAQFARSPSRVNLTGMTVDRLTSLCGATFHRGADFVGSQFNDQFQARGLRFVGSDAAFVFGGVKVAGAACLAGARCAGPVVMSDTCIGRGLELDHARLGNATSSVDLVRLRVGGILARGALFRGPALLAYATIDGALDAPGAVFESKGGLNLLAAKVNGPTILRNCTFGGPLYLNSATFGGELYADHSRFNDPAESVSASSMRAGEVMLSDSSFRGGG